MKVAVIGGTGHYIYALDGVGQIKGDASVVAFCAGSKDEDMEGFYRDCWERNFYGNIYNDYRKLLDAEKPDVVVVNAWCGDNARITAECLRRGVNVFSEKPLATCAGDLDMLEETWRRSDAALGCMFDGPCRGWYKAVRQAVDAGEIGEIRTLHAQKSYRMGQRDGMYRHIASYGGMLPWVGIHAADWICHLVGKPVEAFSAQQDDSFNNGNGEMQTAAAMLMRFQGGVIATVTADYFRPSGSARHDDDRLRVTGTKGMIETADGHVYLENELPKRELPVPGDENPFVAFVRDMHDRKAAARTEEVFAVTRLCLDARDRAGR